MSEDKKINIKDYLPKRNPDSKLWNKVQQLSKKEDGVIEAIDIIFKQQYELPEDSIELIKKLAKKEQSKNVRLHIAKNLEKYDHIPFGMYADLFDILSNDPDHEVQEPLKNTSLYKLGESFLDGFKKIQPESLTNSLKLLSQKQEEVTNALQPFLKIHDTKMVKQITQMQKVLETINLDKIKIPKISFDIDNALLKELEKSKPEGFSVDTILTKAAEAKPEIKEAVESKNNIEIAHKTLDDVSDQIESLQKTTERNFKDVGDKQEEHHTEQMAEHQKTRDELLIDNGKLQEKVDTLQEKVQNSWKEPRNWSIGFAISIIASLVIWAIQSF
ncbi:hypothetical protein [Nitrosopumilus sp.]|uniref:hypothetical protein n=1 Tax=Nitrosopumilus sp. TaxID=2024843 RepID=UPI00247D601B|nr:hypothetical protein [Nitrosopumilus sp.]MCV0430466.1 hypothetical protein [Nitrosopumilus sp.]